MITVRLPIPMEKRLTLLSRKTGRPKSYYIREALDEHIEDMEDAYLALERLEHPGKIVTMKELEQELALEN
ncbi:MAG: ribbon-helix-helix protein, CopG family [Victivallales bacterium]